MENNMDNWISPKIMLPVFWYSFIFFLLVSFNVKSEPPEIKTPAPVIFLADNLDEPDKLGWCIDTKGRGFSEILHAHSCKPRGGDVQFIFDLASGQIKSAAFPDKCATIINLAPNGNFGLYNCKANSAFQIFKFNIQNGEFSPRSNINLCITVGETSRSAGPFMSRGLYLAQCNKKNSQFKSWVIKNK